MSRGYLVIAQNSTIDYTRLAYLLALSIKYTQCSVNNISIAITKDTKLDDKYRKIFDHVIEIPFEDDAELSEWKIENKWKYFHFTPYDETVILDTDMLFTSDVSHWWDVMSKQDVVATTKVLTYRHELITSDYMRKTFTQNNLPNVYTAFMYFKKQSDLTNDYFAMVEKIFRNWDYFREEFLDNQNRQEWISADVIYAMAAKLLDITNEIQAPTLNYPTFVHMKPELQGWHSVITDNWTNHVGFYVTKDSVKIGNYTQHYPIHYFSKNLATDELIKKYEDNIGHG